MVESLNARNHEIVLVHFAKEDSHLIPIYILRKNLLNFQLPDILPKFLTANFTFIYQIYLMESQHLVLSTKYAIYTDINSQRKEKAPIICRHMEHGNFL